MRILLTTTGHAGHVLPLVPFARAARAAGHEIAIAAPSGRADDAERTGFPLHPLGNRSEEQSWAIFESLLDLSPDDANELMVGEVFARMDVQASLPGLLEIAETWRPGLILSEGYEFAGALAGEVHGVPFARTGTGLASMEECVLDLAAPAVDEARTELGLPPDPRAERRRASPYLTRTPPALDTPALPLTYRFRDAAPAAPAAAGPLPDWWDGSTDPLVYVSFGSVAGGLPFFPALYRAAIDALAGLPVRMLVTVGRESDPVELGTLPAGVRVERWVPQEQVAREAAVVVGHGGYGSTLGALVQGVPMVVVPLFADQPYNAVRVAELGAGISLPPFPSMRVAFEQGPASLGLLGDAVSAVLSDPRYRRSAARVAAEARSLPLVEAAVGLLERLAAAEPDDAMAA